MAMMLSPKLKRTRSRFLVIVALLSLTPAHGLLS